MKRPRKLTIEERLLWRAVTQSVKPFADLADTLEDIAAAPLSAAPSPAAEIAPVAGPPRKTPPRPLAPISRRLRQRIARGTEEIGARLDLHGLTQREAFAALLRFLVRAQAQGATNVLVITGKGSTDGDYGSERGVLKRQVPHWLRQPEFREFILGFEDAHRAHGGEGALYIRLRRRG